jgi:hypothetical protein
MHACINVLLQQAKLTEIQQKRVDAVEAYHRCGGDAEAAARELRAKYPTIRAAFVQTWADTLHNTARLDTTKPKTGRRPVVDDATALACATALGKRKHPKLSTAAKREPQLLKVLASEKVSEGMLLRRMQQVVPGLSKVFRREVY